MKTKATKTTTKTKTNKNTTTSYTSVSKNVYMTESGTYRVRKTIDGVKTSKNFTNKAKAVKYAKSL